MTDISVATLSRIERGAAKEIESATLLALTAWMGTPLDTLTDNPSPPPLPAGSSKRLEATPDIIELYLRADKNLDRRTATALSKMFRAAYDALAKKQAGGLNGFRANRRRFH